MDPLEANPAVPTDPPAPGPAPAAPPAAAPPAAPAAPATPPAAPEPPKGEPDISQKTARLERENKELKDVIKAIKPLLEGSSPQDGPLATPVPGTDNADDLKAAYEAERTSWAVEKQLLKAGCTDTVAALAHVRLADVKVDGESLEGFDVTKFIESYPYLFNSQPTVSTGAPPSGGMATEAVGSIAEGVTQTLKKGR